MKLAQASMEYEKGVLTFPQICDKYELTHDEAGLLFAKMTMRALRRVNKLNVKTENALNHLESIGTKKRKVRYDNPKFKGNISW